MLYFESANTWERRQLSKRDKNNTYEVNIWYINNENMYNYSFRFSYINVTYILVGTKFLFKFSMRDFPNIKVTMCLEEVDLMCYRRHYCCGDIFLLCLYFFYVLKSKKITAIIMSPSNIINLLHEYPPDKGQNYELSKRCVTS